MKIGMIDVDLESRGKCTFPNLALMKLAAYHKSLGDHVEWYEPLLSGHMDIVYLSKVFSSEYTHDYLFPIDADKVVRGGSGYAISVIDGKEVYDKALDQPLDPMVEHQFPDYSIYERYGIKDTAYGFLTRGCPRNCPFCHVGKMQGLKVHDHSPLSEFWNGQKKIVLLDPNLTACKDYFRYMEQLAETKAVVDFSQGLDIRLLTKEKIETLNKVKYQSIHFAWDRPEQDLRSHFQTLADSVDPKKLRGHKIMVYILTNYNSSHAQDVERVEFVKSLSLQPYVMIYRKNTAPKETRRLQRYANNPYVCWKCETFDDYKRGTMK